MCTRIVFQKRSYTDVPRVANSTFSFTNYDVRYYNVQHIRIFTFSRSAYPILCGELPNITGFPLRPEYLFKKVEDFDFTYDVTNSAYNTLPFPTVKDPASIDSLF